MSTSSKKKLDHSLLLESAVAAGFPSIAEDYIDRALDLNQLLIEHPAATFFVRVAGDSMIGAGIHDQDIVIVDRAITAQNKSIVIARVDGELTIKRLIKEKGRIILRPENPEWDPLIITQDMDFDVWGVVTCVIHRV